TTTTKITITRPQGKISTLLHKAPWLEAYKKIIEKYQSLTGNEVVLETVAGIPDLRDKYLADATQGTALYDIYTLVPVIALSLIPNHLYPIEKIYPDYKPDRNIIQHPYGFYKGSNYLFPLNNNPEIFFYRKDLFDEVGLKPPITWDDVIEAAKTLHNPSKEIYGFIPRGSADPITEYTMLRSFGGDWFVDWENGDFTVRVNDAKGLATFETLAELVKYSPPSPNTISQTDIGNYMMSGKGAQTLVVAALATSMDNPNLSKVPNLIDYAPPPRGAVPEGIQTCVDGGFGLGVPLKSKNIDVAIDFAEYCATKDAQYLMVQYGTAPCRIDVANDPNLLKDPNVRYLKAAAKVIPQQVSWPCIPEEHALCQIG
ncbi:MAG: extracellular solute-binding protein, partial [Nitrososphaeria archaeon]